MKHSWKGGNTCIRCGLHRKEYVSSNSMRYYRDGAYEQTPGTCDPGARERELRLASIESADAVNICGVIVRVSEPYYSRCDGYDALIQRLRAAMTAEIERATGANNGRP